MRCLQGGISYCLMNQEDAVARQKRINLSNSFDLLQESDIECYQVRKNNYNSKNNNSGSKHLPQKFISGLFDVLKNDERTERWHVELIEWRKRKSQQIREN